MGLVPEYPVVERTMPGPRRTSSLPPPETAARSERIAEPMGFEEDAGRVLRELRQALAQVLLRLPDVERAVDLRRRLGLDAALAWQVFSFANTEDVLEDGRLVPKAGAMQRFLEAAGVARVDPGALAAVRGAYDSYGAAIAAHAGERETFDAMVQSLRPPDASALIKQRRVAFRANAALWGVTIRTAVNVVIFHQRPTGEHDCLCVRGRVGVRGLRPGVEVGIYASTRTWGDSQSEKGSALAGCQLIEQACSSPLPRIERREVSDGTDRDFLVLRGLGKSGEATVFWTAMSRDFAGGSREPPHGCTFPATEPAERLVTALVVPQGWTNPSTASVRVTPIDVHGLLAGLRSQTHLAGPSLPFEGRVVHARSLEALRVAECPALEGLAANAIDQAGWSDTPFDVYRCILRFPVLHSMVHLWADGERTTGQGS